MVNTSAEDMGGIKEKDVMSRVAVNDEGAGVKCPECDLDALYRYGRTGQGKQRFLCLLCGRQFTQDAARHEVKCKPECPRCGKRMHLYKREGKVFRFRCSDYPLCKTFKKTTMEGEDDGLLHS
ncbi:MAG: IS1 family transposase [Nitrospirota bacterium]